MPTSHTPVLERIARVLAGQRLSLNAKGDAASASAAVDAAWRDYLDDADAVLRTIREPDEVMASAGNPDVWESMVFAALGIDSRDAKSASPSAGAEFTSPGAEPWHGAPLEAALGTWRHSEPE